MAKHPRGKIKTNCGECPCIVPGETGVEPRCVKTGWAIKQRYISYTADYKYIAHCGEWE